MKPIGPLMWEHRRIERMITLLGKELNRMTEYNEVDIAFIEDAVDFIRTYADKTHHGKEEDILFRELNKKELSDEHRKVMNELIEEHVYGRKTVSNLVSAKELVMRGDKYAIRSVMTNLQELVQFYPKHIEKEDKHFFFPILDYFTEEEQNNMLREFNEFDQTVIHEKYERLIEELEGE